VNRYNDTIVSRINGIQHSYLAADSLQEAEEVGLLPPQNILNYVAAHTPPGLPQHTLNIKINAIYRLMRNFSVDAGLVKNTRVIVTSIGTRLVTVRILRGIRGGCFIDAEDILLPRINFSHGLHSGHTLLRRQFPLSPAYATTFNSCQGLTLDRVGVDLMLRPCPTPGLIRLLRSHRSSAAQLQSFSLTPVTVAQLYFR